CEKSFLASLRFSLSGSDFKFLSAGHYTEHSERSKPMLFLPASLLRPDLDSDADSDSDEDTDSWNSLQVSQPGGKFGEEPFDSRSLSWSCRRTRSGRNFVAGNFGAEGGI